MRPLELYGTRSCPFTTDLREHLLWQGQAFVEYDVEADPKALRRMLALTNGDHTVPVLVEDNAVVGVGWRGRGCVVHKLLAEDEH